MGDLSKFQNVVQFYAFRNFYIYIFLSKTEGKKKLL